MELKASTLLLLILTFGTSSYFLKNKTLKVISGCLLVGILVFGITAPYLHKLF